MGGKQNDGKKHKGSKGRYVLKNHVQYGKKFRPLLLDYMLTAGHGQPGFEWVRWALPEMLWIKLLIHHQGLREARELVHAAALAGRAIASAATGSYCLASDYQLIPEHQTKFMDILGKGSVSDMSRAFAVFATFYPEFPMAWLVRQADLADCSAGTEELEQIGRLVGEIRSRRNRPAMEIQVCALFAIVATGGLIMHRMPDFDLISDYPGTSASRSMGSEVRAALNVYLLGPGNRFGMVQGVLGTRSTYFSVPHVELGSTSSQHNRIERGEQDRYPLRRNRLCGGVPACPRVPTRRATSAPYRGSYWAAAATGADGC